MVSPSGHRLRVMVVQLPELGRFGTNNTPGVGGPECAQRHEAGHCQIELVEVRLDQSPGIKLRLFAKHRVPLTLVETEPHRARRRHRENHRFSFHLLQSRPKPHIHAYVGDTQIARQELNV